MRDKKGFCRCISSKRNAEENVGPLLSGAGDLLTEDTEIAEALSAAFVSAFTGRTCLQAFEVPR